MWDQLYLAIDEPDGVDDSLDCRVSALPRHFLGHLRACIQGIAVHSLPSDKPSVLDMNNNSLSSKVKALLRDLPREERSVIFSASKATIQHLESVFQSFGIGCRSLFSGQKVECSERAVLEWQSTCSLLNGNTIPCPVLLVQAGAAASGLTLTAACKMFLLEPFLRLSEEQQACKCTKLQLRRAILILFTLHPTLHSFALYLVPIKTGDATDTARRKLYTSSAIMLPSRLNHGCWNGESAQPAMARQPQVPQPMFRTYRLRLFTPPWTATKMVTISRTKWTKNGLIKPVFSLEYPQHR